MSTLEITDGNATEREDASGNAARSGGVRRRRLSEDEKRAIAQLYADPSTPTAEIRERFGIGESSLYRVVQGHGVPLRGRRSSATARGAEPVASAPDPAVRTPGVSTSPRRARKSTRGAAGGATAAPRTAAAAQQEFRIRFQAVTVLEASDVRAALRQAEALGAIDITAVVLQS